MSDKPDASPTSNDGLELLAAAVSLHSLNSDPTQDFAAFIGSRQTLSTSEELFSSDRKRTLDQTDTEYWDKRRRNNEAARRSREKRKIGNIHLESRVEALNKENDRLKNQLEALAGMDLRKGAPQPEAHGLPSPAPPAPTSRVSAFTPLGQGLTLPTPTSAAFGMRYMPDANLASRPTNDVSAAYNALATANLFANLAGNPSVLSYLYGLNSQPGQFPLSMGRLPPVGQTAFSPAAANPVLKELITASMGATKPTGTDQRRQSPDTTTGQNPSDISHAHAKNLLRETLLHKAVPSPSLPDSGTHAHPPMQPAIPNEALLPPMDLRQLSVQVPAAPMSSGPNSVSSIGPDRPRDGRYLERRKRNNEAAKRCRANRRALFEYRFKRSQELEVENTELKNQISKLRMDLANLQELIKSRGLQVDPNPAQEAIQPPDPPVRDENRESGHESDFSSYGDHESHPDHKKTESMGSWSSSSPESGVASPTDQGLVIAPPEDHE